jgi:ribosome-binding factor A
MSDVRVRRVAELLKHETASILANDINDPRVHEVVLTRVKVTKDLGTAWLYYSSYDKKSLDAMGAGLEKSAGFIRKLLMERIHMKKLPKLIFLRDDIPEQVSHLDELLKQVQNEPSVEE